MGKLWFSLGSLATLALLLGSVGRTTAGVIDTTGSWNGSSNVYGFGNPSAETVGQTFTATADLGTQLDSFSFWLQHLYIRNSPTQFSAYVMGWDGAEAEATGSVLYASSPLVLPTTSDGFHEFTFNTGGVSLNAGSQYVLFMSISAYGDYDANGDTETGVGCMNPANNPLPYNGGRIVYQNYGDPSAWTTSGWSSFPYDLAFQASFSSPAAAVPEPTTLIIWSLLGTLAIGIGWWRRRKAA